MATKTCQIETIREFLELPSGALPAATFLRDSDSDLGNAWGLLREYVADPDGCMRWEAPIMLTADRDGWRDGVRVVI